MINSRALSDLDPFARTVCQKHIDVCKLAGIELIICSTYRDYEEQTYLWSLGRTVFPDGDRTKIVTEARAGESWHNFKSAWDAVPLVRGKADWSPEDPTFKKMIQLGIQVGAESGQSFPIKDYDHFQVRPTFNGVLISILEAKRRFDAHGSIFPA